MEVIMFQKPKGFDTVIKNLSLFEESIGFKILPDRIETDKIGTTYKISATIKFDNDSICQIPEEGYDLGIISLAKMQKILQVFENEKDVIFYIKKNELGLYKLHIVADKKILSLPISDLIKSDNAKVNKNKNVLFEISLNNDIISFIKQASKIANNPLFHIGFQKDLDNTYTASFIIGNVAEGSEYLSTVAVKEGIQTIQKLKESKIANLFFQHGNYELIIKYLLNDIIKSFNNENLKFILLETGGVVISETGQDYEIDYGFIPIQ